MAVIIALSQATKVLIINDIHLDVNNTALYSVPGTEASVTTLEKVLSEASKKENESGDKIEAILLVGDLCRHHLAANEGSPTNQWELMKYTMREAIKPIIAAFPDIPILPVVGNNDVPYHDQAPTEEQEDWYYGDLWEIWFEEVPANAHIVQNKTIEESFKNGGWYVYEVSPDVMIFCLNGMYPFYENWEAKEKAVEMIEWVNQTLEANPDMHFITQTHVYFGNNYYNNLEILWNKTYTDTFLKVLQPHQERMILAVGAHIHHVQMMAPLSSEIEGLEIVQVISPAVSPIYMNNPGYGSLQFSAEKHVESLIFRFFQIEDYIRLGIVDFEEYDIQKYTKVDLNDAHSVRSYITSLYYNYQAYAGYISRNMGLRDFLAQGSQFFWPFFSKLYSDQAHQVAIVCSLSYFDTTVFPPYCQRAITSLALPDRDHVPEPPA